MCVCHTRLAQLVERWPFKPVAVGSSPTPGMPCWRNWIARETSNLEVVGSSPTQGTL